MSETIQSEEVMAVETAIAVNPLDMPNQQFRENLERRKINRKSLVEWVRESLVEGVDFGRIHFVSKQKCPLGNECKNPKHFAKPSLFKPGAEKILGMLGATVTWPNLSQYEAAAIEGKTITSIILRCEMLNSSGEIIASGVGARSVSQDDGDLNKALKMAKKSGMIDATLTLGGLSEIFTQDIEDMVKATELEEPVPESPPDKGEKSKNNTEKQRELYNLLCEIIGMDAKKPFNSEDREALSNALGELTGFENKNGEIIKETSLKNLKGKWLNVTIGKAKSKLAEADKSNNNSKSELLKLLEHPGLPQKHVDVFKAEIDRQPDDEWYQDNINLIKKMIEDIEDKADKQGEVS